MPSKNGILGSSSITGLKVGAIATVIDIAISLNGSKNEMPPMWQTAIGSFLSFFAIGFAYRLVSNLVMKHTPWKNGVRVGIALAVAGGVVPAVLLIAIGIVGRFTPRPLAPFEAGLNEYTATFATDLSVGYVRGKIVTVEIDSRRVDSLFLHLPEELRAVRPEEVETIVWLKWHQQEIATYTDGSRAFKHICDVTVIDRSRGVIVAQKTIWGESPIVSKYSGGAQDFYGARPTQKILDYLIDLPRQIE